MTSLIDSIFIKWKKTSYFIRWMIVVLILVFGLGFLDYCNIPSRVAGVVDGVFKHPIGTRFLNRVHNYMGEWGELTTFIMGCVITLLIPSKMEGQIQKVDEQTRKIDEQTRKIDEQATKIDDQTTKILTMIRGNLNGFQKVYNEVCSLLTDIKDDKQSCFLMVSQSPLLGADMFPDNNHDFYKLLILREHQKNRIICLSPFHEYKKDDHPHHRMFLQAFYDSLAVYKPKQQNDTAANPRIFPDSRKMLDHATRLLETFIPLPQTDVMFSETIPYQIFIRRKSNGTRKCVFLLNDWEAIKKNLPAGGFVSEDPIFLNLVEQAVESMIGTHRNIYELAFEHTKEILNKCYDYAASLDFPAEPGDVKTDHKDIKKYNIENCSFIIYPYVFDPDKSESTKIMIKSVKRTLEELKDNKKPTKEKPLQLLDLGCGTGVLSVVAAKQADVEVLVTPVDINPFAIACTDYNVKYNKVDSKVILPVLLGNKNAQQVFSPVANRKFDLIMADLPFLNTYPCYWKNNISKEHLQENCISLQQAYLDDQQELNKKVLDHAKDHLEQDGKLIISFSDLDSVEEFKSIINQSGWKIDRESEYPEHQNNHDWYAFVLCR